MIKKILLGGSIVTAIVLIGGNISYNKIFEKKIKGEIKKLNSEKKLYISFSSLTCSGILASTCSAKNILLGKTSQSLIKIKEASVTNPADLTKVKKNKDRDKIDIAINTRGIQYPKSMIKKDSLNFLMIPVNSLIKVQATFGKDNTISKMNFSSKTKFKNSKLNFSMVCLHFNKNNTKSLVIPKIKLSLTFEDPYRFAYNAYKINDSKGNSSKSLRFSKWKQLTIQDYVKPLNLKLSQSLNHLDPVSQMTYHAFMNIAMEKSKTIKISLVEKDNKIPISAFSSGLFNSQTNIEKAKILEKYYDINITN